MIPREGLVASEIGNKNENRFRFSPNSGKMADGTRLKDMNEHISVLESKMQKLT